MFFVANPAAVLNTLKERMVQLEVAREQVSDRRALARLRAENRQMIEAVQSVLDNTCILTPEALQDILAGLPHPADPFTELESLLPLSLQISDVRSGDPPINQSSEFLLGEMQGLAIGGIPQSTMVVTSPEQPFPVKSEDLESSMDVTEGNNTQVMESPSHSVTAGVDTPQLLNTTQVMQSPGQDGVSTPVVNVKCENVNDLMYANLTFFSESYMSKEDIMGLYGVESLTRNVKAEPANIPVGNLIGLEVESPVIKQENSPEAADDVEAAAPSQLIKDIIDCGGDSASDTTAPSLENISPEVSDAESSPEDYIELSATGCWAEHMEEEKPVWSDADNVKGSDTKGDNAHAKNEKVLPPPGDIALSQNEVPPPPSDNGQAQNEGTPPSGETARNQVENPTQPQSQKRAQAEGEGAPAPKRVNPTCPLCAKAMRHGKKQHYSAHLPLFCYPEICCFSCGRQFKDSHQFRKHMSQPQHKKRMSETGQQDYYVHHMMQVLQYLAQCLCGTKDILVLYEYLQQAWANGELHFDAAFLSNSVSDTMSMFYAHFGMFFKLDVAQAENIPYDSLGSPLVLLHPEILMALMKMLSSKDRISFYRSFSSPEGPPAHLRGIHRRDFSGDDARQEASGDHTESEITQGAAPSEDKNENAMDTAEKEILVCQPEDIESPENSDDYMSCDERETEKRNKFVGTGARPKESHHAPKPLPQNQAGVNTDDNTPPTTGGASAPKLPPPSVSHAPQKRPKELKEPPKHRGGPHLPYTTEMRYSRQTVIHEAHTHFDRVCSKSEVRRPRLDGITTPAFEEFRGVTVREIGGPKLGGLCHIDMITREKTQLFRCEHNDVQQGVAPHPRSVAEIVKLDAVFMEEDRNQLVESTRRLIERSRQRTNTCNEISIFGEMGIDYAYADTMEARRGQCDLLRGLLQLHKELGTNLVIHFHVRESFNKNVHALASRPKWQGPLPEVEGVPNLTYRSAEEDLRTIVKACFTPEERARLRVYRHCFTGTFELAEDWLRVCSNSYFGLSPKSMWDYRCQLAFVNLPLDRILCETDSPLLALCAPNGKIIVPKEKMTPFHVRWLYIHLAWLRGLDFQVVCDALAENYRRLYDLN